jgi:hypothetical protein
MIKQKLVEIEKSAKSFLVHLKKVYDSSDKKNYKDNLLPFFPNSCGDDLRNYLREPFMKFEERKPEQWIDLLNFMQDGHSLNILQKASASRFIDQSSILGAQFKGHGQIVEFDKHTDERKTQLAICKVAEEKWVVVYHADVVEKPQVVKK